MIALSFSQIFEQTHSLIANIHNYVDECTLTESLIHFLVYERVKFSKNFIEWMQFTIQSRWSYSVLLGSNNQNFNFWKFKNSGFFLCFIRNFHNVQVEYFTIFYGFYLFATMKASVQKSSRYYEKLRLFLT